MHIELLKPFGAEVTDVDLAHQQDPATMHRLIDLLFEQRVVVVRRQQLSHADYVRFGRAWGRPIVHVRDDIRKSEFPELITIENNASKPLHMRDLAVHWHTDSSYEAEPASVTMLYALEAPVEEGETMLVDTAAAYDALPTALREQIDALQVRHYWYGGIRSLNTEGENPNAVPLTDTLRAHLTEVTHALVRPHPVTGRRALFALSGTPVGIVGMADDAALALLRRLKAHVLQPQFRTRVKAGTGDVLIWDNNASLHSARPIAYSDEPGKRRRLLRISTKGIPALKGGTASAAEQAGILS